MRDGYLKVTAGTPGSSGTATEPVREDPFGVLATRTGMVATSDAPEALEGEPLDLTDAIDYQPGAIVSRTLIDAESATLTAFALDEGQRISEHAAPHTALVQILDGTGTITIEGEEHRLEAGESIFMPANVPHAVEAPSRFKMLLTMIR